MLNLILTAIFSIQPVGDRTHQVVIKFTDGGPAVNAPDGRRDYLKFTSGPYTKSQCESALSVAVAWFKEAEAQINSDNVKVLGASCEAIS